MQRIIKISLLLVALLLPSASFAQLSTNPNKFLGNITTWSNVDAGDGIPAYYTLWNQITCENESKWASVEGSRGSFNWGCDRAFNYAKQHGFTYKFHALVWGAQYPNWLPDLSPKERFSALTNWFDHAKEKYNTLPMIDVVNEAVGKHQEGNPMMKETLGGGGKTGYDWLIKAFEMAYERWPDAILIYNDYNSIRWDLNNYIELVRTLRDAGAPIDAYGNQAHELSGISTTELSNALKQQQDALKMPMFITEYDIASTDDNYQLKCYKEQIPIMWEAPYCAGVTLWGYVYGKTWTDNGAGYSGIYKDGKERLAMTWLKEYMASDKAKNAVSPLPGTKKEASIYVRPASLKVARGDVLPICVRARMATKTIEKIDLYVEDELIATMTEAPYRAEYEVPRDVKAGWHTIKAVVTTTDGSVYERESRYTSLASTKKRAPYNEEVPQLPGTINVTEYDEGASGVTHNNSSRSLASTSDGQWMDYTVDVTEDGMYYFDAEIASASASGMFHLAEYAEDNLYYLTEFVDVPKTGGSSTYKTLHGKLQMPLTAGRHIISLMIDKGGFYIKNINFTRYEEAEGITCRMKSFSGEFGVGDVIPVEIKVSSKNSPINNVSIYANNLLVGTSTESPYTVNFIPDHMGTYSITAIITTDDGLVKESAARILEVTSSTPLDIRTVNNDDDETDSPAYNLMGVPVGPDYRGIVIKNGKKYVIK